MRAPANATVTITSDDVASALRTVSVTAIDPTATEAGPTTGRFTVSRTGATTAALTVSDRVGGTATAGSDYTSLSGSVTIPIGASSASVTITPINDTAVEDNEIVVLTLAANAAYTAGTPAVQSPLPVMTSACPLLTSRTLTTQRLRQDFQRVLSQSRVSAAPQMRKRSNTA